MEPEKQNSAFDIASRFVLHTDQNLFLTGKAGTGKTTFLKYIKENSRKRTVVLAPTGVAAINAGGVTIHSFFQLPMGAFVPDLQIPDAGDQLFNNRQSLLSNLHLSASKRELIAQLELLIIDEASMLRADTLDAIDAVLRVIRKRPRTAFGGVQLLFIGDLFQLPPVVAEREWVYLKQYYKSQFFFDAQVLQENPVCQLELTIIYRQNEAVFIDLLNKVRNKALEQDDLDLLNRRYVDALPIRTENEPIPIVLTTHNARADTINQQALAVLPGRVHEFRSAIKGDFNEKSFPADLSLQLKEGAQVMIIRNDKAEERRYYNGKLGKVVSLHEEKIGISFPGEEAELLLEKETWRNIRYRLNQVSDEVEEEELGTFTQFPIRLAWAITIHKSQGLTFAEAVIDAGAAFAPGQVYVALSRVTQLQGLFLRSYIQHTAVRTDSRVLEYAQSQKPLEHLEKELDKGESAFIGQSITKPFRMETLVEMADNWSEEIGKKEGKGIEEKREFALFLKTKLEQLLPIAKKTFEHLREQQSLAESNGYAYLKERTTAAAAYFDTAFQGLIDALVSHAEKMKSYPKQTKYAKAINLLHKAIWNRKIEFMHAAEISKGLLVGLAMEQLISILKTTPEIETGLFAKNNGEKTPTANSRRNLRTSKAQKGDSSKQSLELYLNGQSIEAIAADRNLAISTVANHLVGFVASGELPLEKLVEPARIEMIREAVKAAATEQLGPIKSRLDDSVDYHEIRAVLLADG